MDKTGNPEKEKKEATMEEIYELLSPMRETKLKIQRYLQGLPENYVILLIQNPSEYSMIIPQLVKHFLKQNIPGIYVTLNKPAEDISKELQKSSVPDENLIIIDGITKATGGREVEKSNYHYLSSPRDYLELMELLEESVKKIGEQKKFVIIDSISTLLIYHNEQVVKKFVHSIVGKMRHWNVKGILVMMSSSNKEFVGTIAQFCDRVVDHDTIA